MEEKSKNVKNMLPPPVIHIQGRAVKLNQTREVDIVFIIDTTGSMDNKIKALLSACDSLVSELRRENLNYSVGIVAFGDKTVLGDTIQKTKMTKQLSVFQEMLRKVPNNSGGGNEGESSLEAIQVGVTMFRPIDQAVRVFVLITDEPALNPNMAPKIIKTLLQEEIMSFCVTPNLLYFHEMAQKTGGLWIPISVDAKFDKIKQALLDLIPKIANLIAAVHNPQLGDGSVKTYLSKR